MIGRLLSNKKLRECLKFESISTRDNKGAKGYEDLERYARFLNRIYAIL